MPNIFNYLDYREYLENFYKEKKEHHSYFSFRMLADQAGFKSKSFIKHVIEGKRNLSEESAQALCNCLELKGKAAAYFKDLVAFNQAKTLQLQNLCFSKLAEYNSRNKAKLVLQDQYEFYSKWYHNTIRELVCIREFNDNYEKLAAMLRPRITTRQARQSVELLLKLGLIRKKNGKYEQCDAVISTGDEVRSLFVQNFHLQNIILAGEALDSCPAPKRDISCLILGLSEKSFGAVKSEIQQFRKKLLKIAEEEKAPSRVCHVNFQLFPTSEDNGGTSK